MAKSRNQVKSVTITGWWPLLAPVNDARFFLQAHQHVHPSPELPFPALADAHAFLTLGLRHSRPKIDTNWSVSACACASHAASASCFRSPYPYSRHALPRRPSWPVRGVMCSVSEKVPSTRATVNPSPNKHATAPSTRRRRRQRSHTATKTQQGTREQKHREQPTKDSTASRPRHTTYSVSQSVSPSVHCEL